MAKREITIVIGTLNRPLVVNNLLKQLSHDPQSDKWEIFVFDQSDDVNYQRLKTLFPKKTNFYLFHLDEPNTCRYLNLGWQRANAPVVLYFDDDVVLTKTTVSAHLAAYNDPKKLGVAGRVINDGDTGENGHKIAPGRIKWFGAIIDKNFSSTQENFVDFPYGCNMSFRKKTLEEINGFDEKLKPPIYSYNEVDLGYRINKKYPQSIFFEPRALVYHKRYLTGGTRSYSESEIIKSNAVNYGYFIAKNFSLLENFLFLIRRLPYQVLKQPGDILGMLQGFLSAKKRHITFYSLIILCLFLLFIFLRFWRIPELFFFGIDEEYQTLLASSIVKDFHVIWIGLSAANTGYFIGPGLIYLHAILLWLSGGDPVILGYFASFIGVMTLIFFYLIAREFFDKKTAFMSLALYGFSSFIIYYDRRFWNSTFVPLIAILFFYSLVKAEKNSHWYIFTAFLFASSFHIHASLFIFIPIIILVLIRRLIKAGQKIKIDWLTIFLSTIIYFIITLPLLIYDLVHNFDNLKTPLRLLQKIGAGGAGVSLSQHINVFSSTLVRFWLDFSLPPFIFYSLLFFSISAIAWFLLRRENNQNSILKIIVAIYLLMFLFYPGQMLDYYYLGFFPFFALIIAMFLKRLGWKIIIPIVILSAIVSLVAISKQSINSGLAVKKELIKKTANVIGNRSFYLDTNQNYIYFGGWRYLFEIYGKKPASSQADKIFGWIYLKDILPIKPELRVIVTEDNGKYKSDVLSND